MKKLSLFLIFFIVSFAAMSQSIEKDTISLNDVVNHKFYASTVWGINPMNDGEHYSIYDYERASRTLSIKKYSYKTGEEVETILNLSELGIGWVDPNYSFSKNEDKLLIYTDKEEIYRHSFTANYWVYDFKNEKLIKVSENGKQRNASLSPSGNKVAFVRDNNIFIKDLRNSEEKKITKDGEFNKIINGVPDWVYEEEFGFSKAFEWSPDEKNLAYIKFDESDVKEYTIVKYAGEEPHNSEYELYPGLYTYKYPKAGEDNSIVSVHIFNLETGKTIEADIGEETDIYIPRIRWNNDGSKLGILRVNRLQNHCELLYANPDNGKTEVIISEKNDYYIEDKFYDNILFLEDNEHIILMSERDGYRHLYLYNINGDLQKQLTEGNYDVTKYYGFDANDKRVYYQAAEKSSIRRNVYSIKINGRRKKQLTDLKGVNDAEFSKNFDYCINTFSNVNTPYYVTLEKTNRRQIKVLKDNKNIKEKLENYNLLNKVFFKIKTSDNVELNAYRITPPDFDSTKKYAAVVVQYSGPSSQRVIDRWRFDWEFYLAQQGFVVIGVDTRGTGGKGEEFRKVTYKELGKYETLDLVETAKYIGALPYIDKERIGIWGWSYGGFMVLNAMTKGNGVYNTGIAVAPVTNWRYYDNIYTERFMRKPQDNPEGYDDNSPLNFVDSFEGNLLLAFGTADDNVHPQNSYEFIERMVQNNKQFRVFPYVNRNHSIYGGNTSIHLYTMKYNFLKENLKPNLLK